MDRDVRDLLDAAVGEPPCQVTVKAVRRRVARRRALEAVAGAAAAAVLAGAAVAAVLGLTNAGVAPPVTRPAGAPPYYIQQTFGARQPVIRSTATGAITAVVRCPWRQTRVVIRTFAAADHHAFFMDCERTAGTRPRPAVTGSRIYRFRITAAGKITGYSPVPGGVLPGVSVSNLTAAPDGSELAMTQVPGAPSSGRVFRPRSS